MPIATNPVFPRSQMPAGAVALPFSRSPIWSTVGPMTIGGVEVLQSYYTYPRYRYKASIAYLRQAAAFGELATLISFYNQVGGRYGVWQFDDPSDDTVSTDQTFAFGDGTTTSFQLVRAYGSFVEPVFAVNAITTIKINGVTQSPSNYTVTNKGLVIFNTPPAIGATLTWTGTFMWFCRFDNDEQEFDMIVGAIAGDAYGPLWNASLSFSTVKFGS